MTTHQKSLGDRMKEYENVTNASLYKRVPIILRIDGRAFHTFTSGMELPYDNNFINLMNHTMVEVFESISDTVLGYVESDEISILICPYATYDTEPAFSARIQKLCSVAASIATQAFIKELHDMCVNQGEEIANWANPLFDRNITFDCRCFNLAKEEVENYFLWRQQDCKRNSILNAAHEYLGKKKSVGFKTPELIDKMLNEKGIDYWTLTPNYVHYGRSCYRGEDGKTKIWPLIFRTEQVSKAITKMINFDYEERSEYTTLLEACKNDIA